jgi:hypothetical protein
MNTIGFVRIGCLVSRLRSRKRARHIARDERTNGNERTMSDAEKTESGEGASTKKMRVVDQRRYDERARHAFLIDWGEGSHTLEGTDGIMILIRERTNSCVHG